SLARRGPDAVMRHNPKCAHTMSSHPPVPRHSAALQLTEFGARARWGKRSRRGTPHWHSSPAVTNTAASALVALYGISALRGATGPWRFLEMPRRLTTHLYDNAYLLLSFMALCWAGNQVLGRAVAGHIPPIAFSFLRWSLATMIVLPFGLSHV